MATLERIRLPYSTDGRAREAVMLGDGAETHTMLQRLSRRELVGLATAAERLAALAREMSKEQVGAATETGARQ